MQVDARGSRAAGTRSTGLAQPAGRATPPKTLEAGCCIAGGGPAGMMLGYLLARAGVDVVVLEKHADFLRDFRGDTIHPSTLEVLGELGLLDEFLARPHQQVRFAEGEIGDERVRLADFTHLPTRCKFIAFVPQWEFLDFLGDKARGLPSFRLCMSTEATDLLRDGERVEGVVARSGAVDVEVRAHLVVAADGRDSRLRGAAGLVPEEFGAPMDVLWFKLARRPDERSVVLGRIEAGQALVMLERGDYWQCALLIRKGTAAEVRAGGLPAFRARIARLARREAVDEIASLDDVKLLTVSVDRLREWSRPGLLFIGDAAHAMSPIGGVGINLAIQDAVAAANVLAHPLRHRRVTIGHLRRIEERRRFPTRATQALQLAIQNRVIRPILAADAIPRVPFAVRLLQRWPVLQRIPARVIGLGVRPEHVRTDVIST
jgi:2-polyprenyl-6-methoxyphenol hydroxylase-like FAD-dependent oxidoreductase